MLEGKELEEACQKAMDEIVVILEKHNIKDSAEVAYALAQISSNMIDGLEEEEEDKGGIVSDIIEGYATFHQINLAIYREFLRFICERTVSTLH